MSIPDDGGQSVNLIFKLSKDEFVQGTQRGYQKQGAVLVIVPVSVAAGILYGLHLHSQGSSSWILLVGFSLAWWPFFYFALPGVTFQNKTTTGQERAVTFSSKGSHHQGETYVFDRAWSTYRRCCEFPDAYVLTYSMGNSTTIPRRAFRSEADEVVFRALASRHLRCDFSTN